MTLGKSARTGGSAKIVTLSYVEARENRLRIVSMLRSIYSRSSQFTHLPCFPRDVLHKCNGIPSLLESQQKWCSLFRRQIQGED